MRRATLLSLLLTLIALPALAVEITGKARVVDGDTLDIEGLRVRLHGIDAPEMGQSCLDARGRPWACGTAARDHLATLADHKTVTCVAREWDRYKRLIATCRVGAVVLQDSLVQAGLAYAFTRYSQDYVGLERVAQSQKRGLWAGTSEAPWLFRDQQWQTGTILAGAPQTGCIIKGNISNKGEMIYHMPWSPWYGKITMNEAALARGKKWFCDEQQAQAAGFRPANWSR